MANTQNSVIRRKHIQDVNLLHKESPYGNLYTPVIKPKIIGSKLVQVREDNPLYRNSPRDLIGRHPLSPRSRSRPPPPHPSHQGNRVTGGGDGSASHRYGAADNRGGPDTIESRRQENLKLRQDFFTERDPNVGLHLPNSALSDRHGLNPYQPLPPIGGAMETAALLNGLYSRLPPYTGKLMSNPVQLSQEEEFAVLRELHSQLRYLDMAKLKQVYMELANNDDQLSGLCTFEELNQAFLRNNIYLSNPVARLVASVFLSHHQESQRVNYEKVLSFVGASLHLGQQQQPDNISQYYQPPTHTQANGQYSDRMYYQQDFPQIDEPHHHHRQPPSPSLPPPPLQLPASSPPPSPSRSSVGGSQASAAAPHQPPPAMSTDRDLPRALRQLEAEVAAFLSSQQLQQQQPRVVNFESLRLAFQRADRLMRGTLSRDQMKRLVWDSRLPFSEPLLDSLVGLCRHRGGGQYDWEQFVGLLERGLAAHSTGLRIPVARQPLDYAKQLPEPTPSWPHAEQPQVAAATPLYRGSSPQPQPPQPQLPMQAPPVSMMEPWFNRYMKLADALYRRDSEARGALSESQVKEVVLAYNAAHQLGISAAAVQAALDASRGAGGRVNINEVLRRLSVRSSAGRV